MKQNPVNELKKVRAERQKKADKEAKLAAMTDAERARRERQKEERDRIRKERLEREAAETQEIRARRIEQEQEHEDQIQTETAERRESMKRELVEHINRQTAVNEDDFNPKHVGPSKRRRPSNETMHIGDEFNASTSEDHSPSTVMDSSFFAAPSRVEIEKVDELALSEAKSDLHQVPLELLQHLASYRVFYSDSNKGTGLWGVEFGKWSRASCWAELIESFNSLLINREYAASPVQIESGQEINKKFEYKNGEYNFVVSGSELQRFIPDLPRLMNTDGDDIDLSNVVFRITRPDTETDESNEAKQSTTPSSKPSSEYYRYKTLREQSIEMHSVLQAAALGFGAPCYTAFCFPSVVKKLRSGKEVQLYGSLYVLKRADKNLNNLAADRVNAVMHTVKKPSEYHAAIQAGVGKYATKKLLKQLAIQSKHHLLNLDLKPGNIMISSDRTTFLVDFDAGMYADASSFCTWEGCMLVNLILLCTHVKCWHNASFSDAFIQGYRSLLLELAVCSRVNSWIFEAIAKELRYIRTPIRDAKEARQKLESICYSYFMQDFESTNYKFNPELKFGKPLIPQLLKFVLDGTSTSIDPEIRRVLGEV